MELILQSLSASTNWNYEDQAGNFEWCKKKLDSWNLHMHQTMKTWMNSNIKKKLESEGLFIAFWLRKTDITDVSIFSFYCHFIREPPHMFRRSISWKKVVFRPIKMISQLSLCLPLAAISYKRLITGSGWKEINSLAQQTICLRTLNEQTLMRTSLCVYWRKFQSSSLGVCCLNEIFLVASYLSTRKKKRIQSNVDNKVH